MATSGIDDVATQDAGRVILPASGVLALVLLLAMSVLPAAAQTTDRVSPGGASPGGMSPGDANPGDDRIAQQITDLQAGRLAHGTDFAADAAPLPDQSAVEQSVSPAVPGSFLVTTDGPYDRRAYDAAGFDQVSWLGSGIVQVDVDPSRADAAVAELAGRPGVMAIEPNRVREFHAVPNDPGYGQQWSHQITDMERAWDETTGSADILVAVIDSGIVASHPDLAGVVTEQVDSASGQIRPGATDNDVCRIGHGTWVAGVLAGVGDNGTGVAGVNWDLSILDINSANPSISCAGPSDAGTIAGIDYAARQGADVVNLSLGGPDTQCPLALQRAVTAAIDAGTMVIASSGNGGPPGAPNVPGSCDGVISVGSVTPGSDLSSFSTANEYVDIVGPGGSGEGTVAADILTTSAYAGGQETTEYAAVAGTSFSAPYVTGVAALILAVNPALTPTQVESLLESTATDLGPAGRDDDYGWGLVNADAVLEAAAGGPVPEPEADPPFPTPGSGDIGDPLRPGGDANVRRISASPTTTEPISQAVEVSRSVFGAVGTTDGREAGWGIIARDDDFADALTGSTLTLGRAPLLFTGQTGPLAAPSATELTRVLAPGSDVYLLGGTNALPSGLEAEIRQLGFEPIRLSGPVREATAVAVADEVDELLQRAGLSPSPAAVVVTRQNWPDATTAGQLAAQFGFPILLTPTDSLATETAAALAARDLARVYVVGGDAAVSEQTAALIDAGTDTATVTRLDGRERVETSLAVSTEVERLYQLTVLGRPANALAVNIRRDDAYAHVLSATAALAAVGGLLIPVEGEDGTIVTQQTQDYVTGLGLDIILMGGSDLLSDQAGALLADLSRQQPPG